jgi:hypothetical protein
VKAEVARMEREMTAGIEKHRAKAERDDTLIEFDDMATKSGTTVKDALVALCRHGAKAPRRSARRAG